LLTSVLARASTPLGAVTFLERSGAHPQSADIAKANGGSARTLGPAVSALVAPDGSSIAVVNAPPTADATEISELLVYPAGAGTPKKRYRCVGLLTLEGWSSDSKLILASCTSAEVSLLAVAADGSSVSTIARGPAIEGASFAPNSSDDIVYALGFAPVLSAPAALYTSSATGRDKRQITSDATGTISIDPVWGPSDIVFARQTVRNKAFPSNQLWSINANGTAARQLTHMSVPGFDVGLSPVAISANGEHLLAVLSGTEGASSWTVDLAGKTAVPHQLRASSLPDAISRDGREVLLSTEVGSTPTSTERVPWGGGKPTVLAPHGVAASWNE
jgi:Tol biopolymer transport system component